MTLLALGLGIAVGWFLGVSCVTSSLRRDIADLDAARLQLELDQRHLFDQAVRSVRASNPPPARRRFVS